MSYRLDLDGVTPPDVTGPVPPELNRTNDAANATPFFPKAWRVCAGRTPHGDLVHEKELHTARLQALIARVDEAIALLSREFPPEEVTAMTIEFTPRTNSEIKQNQQAPKGIHRAQVAEASEGTSSAGNPKMSVTFNLLDANG